MSAGLSKSSLHGPKFAICAIGLILLPGWALLIFFPKILMALPKLNYLFLGALVVHLCLPTQKKQSSLSKSLPNTLSTPTWMLSILMLQSALYFIFYGLFFPTTQSISSNPASFYETLNQIILKNGLFPWPICIVVALAMQHCVFHQKKPSSLGANMPTLRFACFKQTPDQINAMLASAVDIIISIGGFFIVASMIVFFSLQLALLLAGPSAFQKIMYFTPSTLVFSFCVLLCLNSHPYKLAIKFLCRVHCSVGLFLLLSALCLGALLSTVLMVSSYLDQWIQLPHWQIQLPNLNGHLTTIYYGSWWLLWAPIVGSAIAVLSKGRSTRQIIIVNLSVTILVISLLHTLPAPLFFEKLQPYIALIGPVLIVAALWRAQDSTFFAYGFMPNKEGFSLDKSRRTIKFVFILLNFIALLLISDLLFGIAPIAYLTVLLGLLFACLITTYCTLALCKRIKAGPSK